MGARAAQTGGRHDGPLTGAQRAAVLVMYLHRDTARALLEQLDDEDIRAIGLAMGGIEKVEKEVIEQVVSDFVRDLHDVSVMPRSGAEYVSEMLPQLLEGPRGEALMPVINRHVSREFEQFIALRSPAAVAAIVGDEHPQTQAVALCLMGAANAARVLRHLTPEARAVVTRRMARLKRVPGELADDVVTAIREALGRQDDHLEVGGIDRTARVLGRMAQKENAAILDELADQDEDLATALRRRMVLFEDLAQLAPISVQALLKNIEREDLLLALKGASPAILDLFLGNVSSRAAEDIKEELEILAHVPRARMREAQERIVAVAMKLAEDGALYLPMGAGDDGGEDA